MADLSPEARMSQRGPGVAVLGPDSIDNLGRAVLLLAKEVSVLTDRQLVLEAVLAERGIDVADAVRDHQPSGRLAETLHAERERLARSIIDALCPPSS